MGNKMKVEISLKREVVFDEKFCLKSCPGSDSWGSHCKIFDMVLGKTEEMRSLRCKECLKATEKAEKELVDGNQN